MRTAPGFQDAQQIPLVLGCLHFALGGNQGVQNVADILLQGGILLQAGAEVVQGPARVIRSRRGTCPSLERFQ